MNTEATINVVTEQDNEALAAMIKAVFEEHDAPRCGTVYSDPATNNLYQLFGAEKSVLWVARMGDKIAGCCGIYPTEGLDKDCAEVVKFYLPAAARGRGIGRALMEKSIESAQAFGYKKIYLESLPHFAKAVSIYKKIGFKTLAAPLGYSGHSTCNIWMLKEL